MYEISMITGDGIGPELADSASAVIKTLDEKLGIKITLAKLAAGDAALKDLGSALPKETLDSIKNSDACLKAPVGESAAKVIVVLRRKLDLYANLRPAKSHPGTAALRDDIDLLVVRENTEDLYSGHEIDLGDSAVALRIISKKASLRIAKNAFESAVRRSKENPLVTCVHKSNVMPITDGIFRNACSQVAKKYPNVRLEQMYVDACAMNLIRRPHEFDVIVTTNMFGDILSDESSQIVGGLGMAPAANVGDDFALFEPVHGAAFDIAGKQEANPSSFILSVKMMLEWLSSKHGDDACHTAASKLENAVYGAVRDGAKTVDIGGSMSTVEFTGEVLRRI